LQHFEVTVRIAESSQWTPPDDVLDRDCLARLIVDEFDAARDGCVLRLRA
jgi:hypothetical protein